MSTARTWFSLGPTSILALGDLTDNLRDSLLAELDDMRATLYGSGGTIGTAKALFTYASSKLSLSASAEGITGDGAAILAVNGATEWENIPFADSGVTLYYIGARRNFYPSDVSDNTIDGLPFYTEVTEGVGELGAPDLVTDTGTGLAFRIDTLVKVNWTVGGGASRPVKVWMVNPVTGVLADAIVSGTAVASGGHIVVTITGYLGQITPSLTEADYQILVQGPTVTTTDISANADYWFMGTISAGSFANSSATLMPPYGTWFDTFSTEHDFDTGTHTNVTATDATIASGLWLGVSKAGRTHRWHLGCPAKGGWETDGAAATKGTTSGGTGVPAGTVFTTPSTNATVKFRRSLEFLFEGADDQSFGAGTHWVIKSLKFSGLRNGATTIDFKFYKGKRDQSSSPAADAQDGATFSVADGGAAMVYENKVYTVNVDPAYHYWVEATLDYNAAASEIEWHNLEMTATVKRLD